ncbi:uncharacterized protein PO1_contig-127-14 [Mycobacterium sp. PO1]|nr:uncharacterized protein PO1_contig-127-14 [Mycobacterium sp. PO1]GFM25384.1 uncharacterized protein PO2_contig-065-8 [Mycobacterium sp. PO2]
MRPFPSTTMVPSPSTSSISNHLAPTGGIRSVDGGGTGASAPNAEAGGGDVVVSAEGVAVF